MSEDNREKLLDKIISLVSEYGVSGAGILGGLVVAFLIIALFDHEKRLEALDTLSRRLGQQIEKLTTEKEELKHVIESSSRKIGFTASVPSTSKYWNSGTLVFSKVITNTGNGYNPNNGVFTAPVRGKYVFFVNVQCLDKQSIYVDIVLNDRTVLRTMAYSNYDAGPNLAVLSLRQEDRVWVRHAEGRGYFNDPTRPLTTFSGFLL
ncbi:complement C1q tumor necrosis factor-related protein 3-like [Crassostrea virginica]